MSQERNQLSITLTNLQVDFDNLNARLDEEAETSASLRAQLQRAQADYAALKSKYDKEVTMRIEEFEETRYFSFLFLSANWTDSLSTLDRNCTQTTEANLGTHTHWMLVVEY